MNFMHQVGIFPPALHSGAEPVIFDGMLHDALKRRRKAARLTQEKLAELMDKSQPTIQRWESGTTEPSLPDMRRLAEIFGVPLAELMDDRLPPTPLPERPAANARMAEVSMPFRHEMPRDLPVHGTAWAADLILNNNDEVVTIGRMELSGVTDTVRRPPALIGNPRAYAIYVEGDSMEPRWSAGDLVFVDPRRPPSPGDFVVVQLREADGHDGEHVTCAMIKRLIRRTASHYELEQFNPPLRFRLPTEQVKEAHRIPSQAELMGV